MIIRNLFTWLLLVVICGKLEAQNFPKLSEDARISILTMGPDQNELYSAFGHNAIRVVDASLGIDKSYNYGTFDYNDPNFYVNFTKGYLLYFLSVGDTEQLLRYYIYFDRFVNEQVLDLNPKEKQRVFDYLENNAMPENARYYYDYFYDNCATRIRDVFVDVFGDSIRFELQEGEEMTIRELTDIYLEEKFPWGDLGIDICLGLPMDKRISAYDYMFLPDYIESGFNHAFMIEKSGEERALVLDSSVLHASQSSPKPTIFSPLTVSLILMILGLFITWAQWRLGKKGKGFDFFWFSFLGLLGLLLTGLWFLTDHTAAAYNFNILWAFPIHAFASFLVLKGASKLRVRYFNLVGMGMILLLLAWSFLPQDIHFSIIPIVILTMVRAFYISHSYAYNHQRI